MKEKLLTFVSLLFVFIPWTILPLRTFNWALESPIAEITIICYMIIMVIGGLFSILSYIKGNVKNKLLQICMVINSIYAFGGIVLGGWMAFSAFI